MESPFGTAAPRPNRKLLAFLGTGNYESTVYRTPEGREHESRFCTVALARAYGCDETVVLTTDEAHAKHGEALRAAFREFGGEVRLQRIASGRDEAELSALFEALRKESEGLEDSTELLIDITHGFRVQPFFAGALAQYLNAVRPQRLGHTRLLYGAFEARQDGVSPVWDLSAYLQLVALCGGLRVFLETGHAKRLLARLEALGRASAKRWASSGRSDPRPALDRLTRDLRELCAAFDGVRIGALLLGADGQPSLAARVRGQIQGLLATQWIELPLLREPLRAICDRLAPLVVESDHLVGQGPALEALARLYLDWGRLPEAAIVLREGMVCLYAEPEAARPGRGFDRRKRQEAEARLRKEAEDAYREIAEIRNDIQHGGFNVQPLPGDRLRARLEAAVGHLVALRVEPEERSGTTWFVSRHPGALAWARTRGLLDSTHTIRILDHLDLAQVRSGDHVIGTLPVHLAAQVCQRGARFSSLAVDVPLEARGRELSAEDLERYGARLEGYSVLAVGDSG
jgi:CRISPR-associated protein Csx16